MIIRQFLLSTQHASSERRAEAAAALARAYLHGHLGPDAAWEAKTTLLALLDDPSALVRRALAEACAASPQAPRPLIVALASDEADIACLVLARSSVLMDADLVDCAAIGCERARSAIAGRAGLSKPVAAALAEVAGPAALAVLARNAHAAIGRAAFLRMIERHGDDADLREALLARGDLAIEVRQSLAARAARALAAYTQACGWVGAERSERMAREASENATLALSDEVGEAGLARLVAHLRTEGQLNAGLILRAILSLRMPFVEAALADLTGLSRARVAGLMFEPNGAGFTALIRKSGLPLLLLPAIQSALSAWRDVAIGQSDLAGARLARCMVERALTACETMPFAESRGLMALLTRFEAEAAREEAREIAQALAEEADQQELLRVEREERMLLESPRSHAAIRAAEPTEIFLDEDFPLEAVLEELPAAIVASYRADQERRQAQAVLEGLDGALLESFVASRPPTSENIATPDLLEHPKAAARPRAVALACAASMIPDDLIQSYRADRERVRLAA